MIPMGSWRSWSALLLAAMLGSCSSRSRLSNPPGDLRRDTRGTWRVMFINTRMNGMRPPSRSLVTSIELQAQESIVISAMPNGIAGLLGPEGFRPLDRGKIEETIPLPLTNYSNSSTSTLADLVLEFDNLAGGRIEVAIRCDIVEPGSTSGFGRVSFVEFDANGTEIYSEEGDFTMLLIN